MKTAETLDITLPSAVLHLGQVLASKASRNNDALSAEILRVLKLVRQSPARSLLGIAPGNADRDEAVRLKAVAIVCWQMIGESKQICVGDVARAVVDAEGVFCEQLLRVRDSLARMVSDGLLIFLPNGGDYWDGRLTLPKRTLSWLVGGDKSKGDFDPVKLDLARLRRSGVQDRDAARKKVATAKALYNAVTAEVVGLEAETRTLCSRIVLHRIRAEALLAGVNCADVSQMVVVLVGESGSGKSYLAASLARHSGLPFCTFDASTLTASGFVGSDISAIFHQLLHSAAHDLKEASRGLVLLDEFCKKARRDDDYGVGTECVQVELLAKLQADAPFILGGRRPFDQPAVLFDGRPVGYFLAGVYRGLDATIDRLAGRKNIGFSSTYGTRNHVLIQDALKELGFIDELVNRVSTIVRLPIPTFEIIESAVIKIMDGCNRMLGSQGIAAAILPTMDAVRIVADYSIQSRGYFRCVKSVLAVLLEDFLFDGRDEGVLIEASDVKRAIDRLTSGIIQPSVESAAATDENAISSGGADVSTSQAAGA